MPQLTIDDALEHALRHHKAGELPAAESLYRQVLHYDPDNVAALHLMGVIALHTRRETTAVEMIRRSVELVPGYAEAWHDLGVAFDAVGRPEEAIAAFGEVLKTRQDIPLTHHGLAKALERVGRIDEAISAARKTCELDPSFAAGRSHLDSLLSRPGVPTNP